MSSGSLLRLMKPGLGLVVIAFASALLLVGCGGGGGGETAAVETAEPEAVQAAVAETGTVDVTAGHDLFKTTCAVCHGPNGEGMQNLGKNLNANTFVQGTSDADLVAFLVEGRAADHPDNTQGVAMPPKGGNPMLTEDDLLQIVAYLRSLQ